MQKFINLFQTQLVDQIQANTTLVTVTSVAGLSLTGDDYYLAVLENVFAYEVVKVVAVNAALKQLTIQRAQEGTAASAFEAGATLECRLTAGACGQFLQMDLLTGVVLPFGGMLPPAGWLECAGASLLRADYPRLFNVIGAHFGAADATHFNLPDLRGQFLRGWDHGAGQDPDAASRSASQAGGNMGDALGSAQADALQGHEHRTYWRAQQNGSPTDTLSAMGDNNGALGFAVTSGMEPGSHGTPRVAQETRPKNVNVMFIIKT